MGARGFLSASGYALAGVLLLAPTMLPTTASGGGLLDPLNVFGGDDSNGGSDTGSPLPLPPGLPAISAPPLPPGVPSPPGTSGVPLVPRPPTPQEAIQCASDPIKCIEDAPNKATYDTVFPIVQAYKSYLEGQASGRWASLPDQFIQFAQPNYAVDLHQIRYATGIDTELGGYNITFANEIFFESGQIDFGNPQDVSLLFHELQHSDQYQAEGGEANFLGKYIIQAAGDILQHRTFDVHNFIDLEQQAIEKADQLTPCYVREVLHRQPNAGTDPAGGTGMAKRLIIQNVCPYHMDVAVHYRASGDGRWYSSAYIGIDPGVGVAPVENVIGPDIFYYAQSKDSDFVGPIELPDVYGRAEPMRRWQLMLANGGADWLLRMACDPVPPVPQPIPPGGAVPAQ
jgi:hypothetical protein